MHGWGDGNSCVFCAFSSWHTHTRTTPSTHSHAYFAPASPTPRYSHRQRVLPPDKHHRNDSQQTAGNSFADTLDAAVKAPHTIHFPMRPCRHRTDTDLPYVAANRRLHIHARAAANGVVHLGNAFRIQVCLSFGRLPHGDFAYGGEMRKLEACLWRLWRWLDAFQAYGEVDTNAPLFCCFPTDYLLRRVSGKTASPCRCSVIVPAEAARI
jgi:hypothetical protein